MNKVEHLKMIQGVISRMAKNSFLLKGWSVVVVSALFALAAKDARLCFAYIAFFPAFVFWALDGYFLRQERLFRKLYDNVRSLDDSKVDFSMNTSMFTKEVSSWFRVALSTTLIIFHGGIVAVVLTVVLLVQFLA